MIRILGYTILALQIIFIIVSLYMFIFDVEFMMRVYEVIYG